MIQEHDLEHEQKAVLTDALVDAICYEMETINTYKLYLIRYGEKK